MAFMENLGQKLTGAGKAAIKASSDLVEITRINMAVKSEENRIKNLMTEMGDIIYKRYEHGLPVDSELASNCEEISETLRYIEEMKAKSAELKNAKLCSKCGSETDKNDQFCPKCGRRLC